MSPNWHHYRALISLGPRLPLPGGARRWQQPWWLSQLSGSFGEGTQASPGPRPGGRCSEQLQKGGPSPQASRPPHPCLLRRPLVGVPLLEGRLPGEGSAQGVGGGTTSRSVRQVGGSFAPLCFSISFRGPGEGGVYSLSPLQQPPTPQRTMLIKPHRHGSENRGYRGGEGDSASDRQLPVPALTMRSSGSEGSATAITPFPRHHLSTSLLASRGPGILAPLHVSATCTYTTGSKWPRDVSAYVCVSCT